MTNMNIRNVKKLLTVSAPLAVFDTEIYSREIVSPGAYLVYTFLYPRFELSIEHNWVDEKGDIFLIYTHDELAYRLGYSVRSIGTWMKQLEDVGLIKRVKQGLNKPDLIYMQEIKEPEGGTVWKRWTRETAEEFKNRKKGNESQSLEPQGPEMFAPPSSEKSDTENNDTEKSIKNKGPEMFAPPSSEKSDTENNDSEETYENTNESPVNPRAARTRKDCRTDTQTLPPSLLNISPIDIKDLKKDIKDLPQGGEAAQTNLFDFPKKPKAGYTMSHEELAMYKIATAKETGDWRNVKPRDFTYYYKVRHNASFRPIEVEERTDVKVIRVCLIERHEIPQDKVCDYIDHILSSFYIHPQKQKFNNVLTFYMINKCTSLMDDLVKSAHRRFKPVRRKYPTNTFMNQNEPLRNDSETFEGEIEIF